jgi:uncharacterized SAM-binding protein YcdF (DUF218 family)
VTRLLAVCGYSDGRETGLHAICERRLRLAEREAGPDDVVLLTGWARHADATAEAELMARSWGAACRELHVDSSARSTLGNVRAAVELAERVGASEVVLVTSGWHAPRAGALLRALLSESGRTARVLTTDEPGSLATRARELVCWAGVPFARLRRR